MTQTRTQLILDPLDDFALPVGYAVACLQRERARTLETVAHLTTAQLDLQVEGSPNSVGTLLYHIADIELDWLYAEILEQNIPIEFSALFQIPTRTRDGSLSVASGMTLTEHLERLARVRWDVLESLKEMDSAEFYRVRTLEAYDVNPAWVLYHLLEHEAKHGEQIARICRTLRSEG
jgi:uncharacterized damage-inducible protein DinB